jgi:hypothetical protein
MARAPYAQLKLSLREPESPRRHRQHSYRNHRPSGYMFPINTENIRAAMPATKNPIWDDRRSNSIGAQSQPDFEFIIASTKGPLAVPLGDLTPLDHPGTSERIAPPPSVGGRMRFATAPETLGAPMCALAAVCISKPLCILVRCIPVWVLTRSPSS